jgi:hypothetical protein
MRNGTSSALNSEQDLASIPMAQGGLSRLAIARLNAQGDHAGAEMLTVPTLALRAMHLRRGLHPAGEMGAIASLRGVEHQ